MNVCPGEGMAYDSYYNETDPVTCTGHISAVLSEALIICVNISNVFISAQCPENKQMTIKQTDGTLKTNEENVNDTRNSAPDIRNKPPCAYDISHSQQNPIDLSAKKESPASNNGKIHDTKNYVNSVVNTSGIILDLTIGRKICQCNKDVDASKRISSSENQPEVCPRKVLNIVSEVSSSSSNTENQNCAGDCTSVNEDATSTHVTSCIQAVNGTDAQDKISETTAQGNPVEDTADQVTADNPEKEILNSQIPICTRDYSLKNLEKEKLRFPEGQSQNNTVGENTSGSAIVVDLFVNSLPVKESTPELPSAICSETTVKISNVEETEVAGDKTVVASVSEAKSVKTASLGIQTGQVPELKDAWSQCTLQTTETEANESVCAPMANEFCQTEQDTIDKGIQCSMAAQGTCILVQTESKTFTDTASSPIKFKVDVPSFKNICACPSVHNIRREADRGDLTGYGNQDLSLSGENIQEEPVRSPDASVPEINQLSNRVEDNTREAVGPSVHIHTADDLEDGSVMKKNYLHEEDIAVAHQNTAASQGCDREDPISKESCKIVNSPSMEETGKGDEGDHCDSCLHKEVITDVHQNTVVSQECDSKDSIPEESCEMVNSPRTKETGKVDEGDNCDSGDLLESNDKCKPREYQGINFSAILDPDSPSLSSASYSSSSRDTSFSSTTGYLDDSYRFDEEISEKAPHRKLPVSDQTGKAVTSSTVGLNPDPKTRDLDARGQITKCGKEFDGIEAAQPDSIGIKDQYSNGTEPESISKSPHEGNESKNNTISDEDSMKTMENEHNIQERENKMVGLEREVTEHDRNAILLLLLEGLPTSKETTSNLPETSGCIEESVAENLRQADESQDFQVVPQTDSEDDEEENVGESYTGTSGLSYLGDTRSPKHAAPTPHAPTASGPREPDLEPALLKCSKHYSTEIPFLTGSGEQSQDLNTHYTGDFTEEINDSLSPDFKEATEKILDTNDKTEDDISSMNVVTENEVLKEAVSTIDGHKPDPTNVLIETPRVGAVNTPTMSGAKLFDNADEKDDEEKKTESVVRYNGSEVEVQTENEAAIPPGMPSGTSRSEACTQTEEVFASLKPTTDPKKIPLDDGEELIETLFPSPLSQEVEKDEIILNKGHELISNSLDEEASTGENIRFGSYKGKLSLMGKSKKFDVQYRGSSQKRKTQEKCIVNAQFENSTTEMKPSPASSEDRPMNSSTCELTDKSNKMKRKADCDHAKESKLIFNVKSKKTKGTSRDISQPCPTPKKNSEERDIAESLLLSPLLDPNDKELDDSKGYVIDWIANAGNKDKRIKFSGKTYERVSKKMMTKKQENHTEDEALEYELVKMIAFQEDYEYFTSSPEGSSPLGFVQDEVTVEGKCESNSPNVGGSGDQEDRSPKDDLGGVCDDEMGMANREDEAKIIDESECSGNRSTAFETELLLLDRNDRISDVNQTANETTNETPTDQNDAKENVETHTIKKENCNTSKDSINYIEDPEQYDTAEEYG